MNPGPTDHTPADIPPNVSAAPPAPSRQRLDSLDLLRGVAILGILLMNTQSMSMPSSAYYNPTDFGDVTGANWIAWVIIHILADTKFITIFSIMFGAGIALQAERAAARGFSAAGVHYRRMAILLLFGIAHAYLLWFGDVLVPYCILGMMFFPLRKLAAPLLILAGVCLIGMYSVVGYCADPDIFPPVETSKTWEDSFVASVQKVEEFSHSLLDGHIGEEEEMRAYRAGWKAELNNRLHVSFENETSGFLNFSLWRCGGAILIGMGLHRCRFFHAAWPPQAYSALAAFAIPTGWMITVVGVIYNNANNWNWSSDYFLQLTGEQFNYYGSLIAAFGYMALGNLVAIRAAEPKHGVLAKIVIPIRAVGRTALSNYISQSLICTTIFYGHGFGEYGKFSRVGLVEIVLCVWTFQLTASTLWTRRFKQGPLEWLWHRAVYFGKVKE